MDISAASSAFFRSVSTVCGCLLVASLLGGCGGNNNRNFNSQDVGSLRVLNAISESPALTFSLENSSIATLRYGQANPFTSIRDGRFDLTVFYTGLDNETVRIVDDERVRVRVAEQTVVAVAGTLAAPVLIEIEADDPDIATAASEIIVLNTAGAGSIDAYLSAPGADLGAAIATVPNNTASPVVATDAGNRVVRITGAGSTDVLYDSGEFVLPGATRIILHVQPYFGPGDAALTVSRIDNARTSSFANEDLPATIRIANAVADLPALDTAIIETGNTTELNGVPSNSFGQPSTFTPGTKDVRVNLETDPGTLVYEDSTTLTAGEQRTLLVAGSFSADTTVGRLAVDPQRPIATSAQLNILHGSISSERIDVYLLTDGATTTTIEPVTPNLALLANANLEVLAGTYDLVITRNAEDATLAGPVSITLANNQLYSVLITDADGGGTPPRIILGNNFE